MIEYIHEILMAFEYSPKVEVEFRELLLCLLRLTGRRLMVQLRLVWAAAAEDRTATIPHLTVALGSS